MRFKITTLGAIFARQTIGLLYPPLRRKADYFLNETDPNVINEPSVLTALRRRGKIKPEYFYKALEYQGLDNERADELYALTEKLLDPSLIISAWRRGIKVKGGRSDYLDDLRSQGWSEDKIALLKKVTEFFPAPADLITFAVREVYTPEIIREYGQMEDLPLKFLEEAKKAGLPEEQAKNYWASHWILPSLGQGYEMLHRNILNEDQLKKLMRTQDIMPYWRDKLMAISYKPYTRVDVRRMHKLGIINREQVKRSYLDLGYSDEKAENMTEFTIRYNEDPEELERTEEDKRKEELKGMTRSAVLKQFKDQMINETEATGYLTGLGYNVEVIEFYLSREAYLREEEMVDNYIKSYKRLYVNGVIDYNKLIDLLGKMNLPESNVQYLVSLWDMEKMTKPNQPSKAEIIRFIKKDIINLDKFKQLMSNLGYSQEYIGYYLLDNKLIKA